MSDETTRAAVEAVWRLESTRLVAGLVRIVRDVGLAEDLAQDALVAALDSWPRSGLPDRPAAWLMTTAKRRAVDLYRRHERRDVLYAAIARDRGPDVVEPDFTAAVDHVEDDVLRLMFVCCHPSLTPEAQTTLTLKLVGGLSSREIARAYLTSEATITQRVGRAKRTLTEAGAALDEPTGADRATRLTTVLGVVYLLFNEGYSATEGGDWTRPDLCAEAVRLGRILATLVPDDPEVHGLSALMELQSSRLRARVGPDGEPVLLRDQDRGRWDHVRIRRGLAALDRSAALSQQPGPYALQAEIAACHARAARAEDTDWAAIAALYERLGRVSGTAVVELNRAVALSMAYGPQAGLDLLDQIAGAPALRGYHLLPSVRGDLLERLGRPGEARAEFERAAGLTRNDRERRLLLDRARRLAN
ncbi:RNA polymerase sigma factor [Jiangella sp. DSM 45060]|uniref:RNA polymerase sigma factor n=1 Tax=Jiangella sp. DSM 45060 TaxID=1798224 RepID=UPI00087DB334|nr:RNA polymerase sigma factor [Jiangella sp. DSM 45060]SDS61696.1 RNA polymerase sigma factor, sigma-70 family [Jiangella sp. DSM 45060]